MTPVEVVVLSGIFTLVGSTVAWWLARRDKREERTHSAATPGAPTVQEIWQRQDKMENAFRASLVLLSEIAEQWDGPHPPTLSPRAIQILRENDYLPAELDNLVPHHR